jgi:cytoskeletal protein RodZ
MESEANQETFGNYLKGFRQQRELAIETLAAKTKIAVHCLKAIEDSAHDRLPPPAYVKSFIRTYAKALDADADEAVKLYLTDLEQQENEKKQHLRRRAKFGALRQILMAAGVIIGILLLLRYSDTGLDPQQDHRRAATQVNDRPTPPAAGMDTVDGRTAPEPASQTLKLEVIAVEQTWLKVIVDGQRARSYNLKPEDRLELEGTNNFNLMIGNATGLKILLNDRPVKIFGNSGQVVSLKIP